MRQTDRQAGSQKKMTERQAEAHLTWVASQAGEEFAADGIVVDDSVAFDIARAILDIDSKAEEACKVLGLEEGYDREIYIAERI